MQVDILCAMRDWHAAHRLCMAMSGEMQCTFRIVTSGTEAIETASRLAPDILIVDAVLPGMDGLGVIDSMHEMLGEHMPRVIGGSMGHFADAGFRHRGADALVGVPWEEDELRFVLEAQMGRMMDCVSFKCCEQAYIRAGELLDQVGMKSALKGYHYLSWAAALAHENEARLDAVEKWIYRPIAEEFDTTAQNVERLIRHAVERTMDGGKADAVYRFFGNTIDPARGKPTNAQCISVLVQRLRILENVNHTRHKKRA